MKIKLNLLPKSKEKKIKNKKILKFVILQEVMIIAITLLFFGAIKGVEAIAKYQLGSMKQEIASKELKGEYVEIKKYEESLKEAGVKVNFIKRIQKFNVDWVSIYSKLSTLLPKEIIVKSINGNGLNLLLKGTAQNRDVLIAMKDNVQKDGCFEKVDIPLNNIVLRENIEFEMTLVINMKCLNHYEK